jgi:DnaJ-class molecular chaperone
MEVTMAKKVKCPRCKGKGTIRESGVLGPGKEKTCPNCGGTGYVYEKK